MRLKLKRNYNFNEHRDSLKAPRGAEKEQPQSDQKTDIAGMSKILRPAVGGGDEPKALSHQPSSVADMLSAQVMQTGEKNDRQQQAIDSTELLVTVYAELVRPRLVRKGTLELTMTHLNFYENRTNKHNGGYKDLKVPLEMIREVHLRRYLLRRSA